MSFLDKFLGKKDKVKSYYSREGVLVESDDLLKQLYKTKDHFDTHFSYLNLIGQTYNRRKEPGARTLFKKLATEHIEIFNPICVAFLKKYDNLPRVPTFQYLATVYTEDGEYEKAIEVCERAIAFGLNDGTKGGYQGRIERIKKKV
jgi:tetratricopeptide (TPR) repeat protein